LGVAWFRYHPGQRHPLGPVPRSEAASSSATTLVAALIRKSDPFEFDRAPALEEHFERYRTLGSTADLDEVIRATRPSLLAIARRRLSYHDAEDAVQATFVTMLERAASFDGERRLMPWLRAILISRIADLARRRAPAPTDLTEWLASEEGEAPALCPLERQEIAREIRRAASRLSPETRRALWRRYVLGLEPIEIARQTEERGSTVRMRLARGLHVLRERLASVLGLCIAWIGSAGLAASEFVASPRRSACGVLGPGLGGHRAQASLAAVTVIALGALFWLGLQTPRAEPLVPVASSSVCRAAAPAQEVAAGQNDPERRGPIARQIVEASEPRVAASSPDALRITWSGDGEALGESSVQLEVMGVARIVRTLQVVTDAQGRLDLSSIPKGEYWVLVGQHKLGTIRVGERGRVATCTPDRLEVPSSASRRIVVLDARGSPVAGAALLVQRHRAPIAWTDASGTCACTHLLPTDSLHAVLPDGEVTDCVTVGSEIPDPVVLRVAEHVVEFAGCVVDTAGAPVPDVPLVVLFGTSDMGEPGRSWRRSWAPRRATRTDRGGRFRFDAPAETSSVSVIVESPHYRRRAVAADPRRESPIAIRAVPGGRLAGVVRDQQGEAVGGAAIELRVPGDQDGHARTYSVVSAPDGAFVLPTCRPGSVEVFVDGGEAGAVAASFDLEPGPTSRVFELQAAAPIRGRVVSSSRAPVASAFVELYPAASETLEPIA
jgi:RNA polymerase sigma factor (sigma-70 family)